MPSGLVKTMLIGAAMFFVGAAVMGWLSN